MLGILNQYLLIYLLEWFLKWTISENKKAPASGELFFVLGAIFSLSPLVHLAMG